MQKKHHAPHSATVRRAALPEILFIPDIGLALDISQSAARKAVLRGDCGPSFKVGRRHAVLRDTFLAALSDRAEGGTQP